MNWLPAVILLAFWIGLIAAIIVLGRRGKPTNVVLLPHQRGVLFRGGKPVRDVGPGKYRVWAGAELLVHGDTRPISVNHENQVVSLSQEQSAAMYGFSASVQVRDMRKAIYSARDYTQVPAALLLRCARQQIHLTSAASLRMGKDALGEKIAEAAKPRLQAAGFDLLSLRLTQLALGTAQPPPPSSAPRTPPTA